MKNPSTRSATPLPPDWPSRFAMHVRDEAAHYASAQRGSFPDSQALRERAVERVMRKIEEDSHVIDSADEAWIDRYESGQIDAEIASAVDYYASQALAALEANPALPPFEPVEVEQIRAEMQAAIGAVAERYGLRVQYSELAPTEKVIPVGFKIYRRAPEQRDLFGNPDVLQVGDSAKVTTHFANVLRHQASIDPGDRVVTVEDVQTRRDGSVRYVLKTRKGREFFAGLTDLEHARETNPRQVRISRRISST